MKPIDIGGEIVKTKPYRPLPILREGDQVITCWKLTLRERVKLLLTGKLWHYQIAPHSIQPIFMSTEHEHTTVTETQ